MIINLCCIIGVLLLHPAHLSGEAVPKDWWEKTIFYQIYPRSFMDANNDGIGDLKGVESKLNYLKGSGIDAVWLSPIFESPMVDFGYDISNYTKIQPEYGTMEDFDDMIKLAKSLGKV
jgi:alpha-glucosidase